MQTSVSRPSTTPHPCTCCSSLYIPSHFSLEYSRPRRTRYSSPQTMIPIITQPKQEEQRAITSSQASQGSRSNGRTHAIEMDIRLSLGVYLLGLCCTLRFERMGANTNLNNIADIMHEARKKYHLHQSGQLRMQNTRTYSAQNLRVVRPDYFYGRPKANTRSTRPPHLLCPKSAQGFVF